MPESPFTTNPFLLSGLLHQCQRGELQLPDFQRGWVWDEERIKSLIASVSQGFPIGAFMALQNGGEVEFKPRPVEGAPRDAEDDQPQSLLLDGQQRITSLYQATIRNQVMATENTKRRMVKRWFYIDINKALEYGTDREKAIFGVPEDRVIRDHIKRRVDLDLSAPGAEFELFMYPVSKIFEWDTWHTEFIRHWINSDSFAEKSTVILSFKEKVVDQFTRYQVPVITLDRSTTKEAVCVVFEKVNTGGKALDAFELVTAMYAARGHDLRKDWYGSRTKEGRQHRLQTYLLVPGSKLGVLTDVGSTDFLQAISLFHTRDLRQKAKEEGKPHNLLPAISANRRALLEIPLEAYLKYQKDVEEGFMMAARFLIRQGIYRKLDLPYQSQIVPLAAILTELGDRWEDAVVFEKLQKWYWSGVFGELYGSAVESRIARDFIEVPEWIDGGSKPSTITEATFHQDRLFSMRRRVSAAYKGVNALLMQKDAKDFMSGQRFEHTIFFDEKVDIHHIFPRVWCDNQGIQKNDYNSIVNKTPLTYKTNRRIGGAAPSKYLDKLVKGTENYAPVPKGDLEDYLKTHLVNPEFLWNDNFSEFLIDRRKQLLNLIEEASGILVYRGDVQEEGEDLLEENDDMLEQADT